LPEVTPSSSTAAIKWANASLRKSPTGIRGLDEITGGGLPQGRPTLLCGTAGCGKTLLAMEFLFHGVTRFDEPGAFITFEETPEELVQNVRSLGFDLEELIAQQKFAIDYIQLERSEIEETGEYDLEGLFIRLGFAIDSIGARRVVLDTIEALFGGLSNEAILRAELRRLFRWLKERGVTAVITAERGDGTLTRNGLEEYVSDCVILLDQRLLEQVLTRRLRIVKYRGTAHSTNEFPFIIRKKGISLLPITSTKLLHEVSSERVSSGVPRLDGMLEGGYYRGSSILISGTAGTGKTSLATHFADATCRRGERCLYVALEESQNQVMRNMGSIGLDLQPWITTGLLRFNASRPTMHGLETHLATIYEWVDEFQPHAIVIDPISNLVSVGTLSEVHAMLMRLIDHLKEKQITALLTNLTSGSGAREETQVGVSSVIDTWLLLRDIELDGERNRGLYILKARGTEHSNQIRELRFSRDGIELVDVYTGLGKVLTGSARLAQAAAERAAATAHRQEIERKRRALRRKQIVLEAKIAALQAEFEAEKEEIDLTLAQEQGREDQLLSDQLDIARSRKAEGKKP
jgi:circadian clock protein KaiC